MRFRDRIDAGRQLAERLKTYAGHSDALVLGLPRGGVPVGHEVARRLNLPLDVFLVRKLGVPGHPELAMGAIAAGGIEVLSEDLIRTLRIPRPLIQAVAVRERLELDRRDAAYRGSRRPPNVRDRTVILVDDGLATGSTMQAAILALRAQQPARIIAAAPVGARDTCERLSRLADEVVCLSMPDPFKAVGLWYEDFSATSDDDVKRLLAPAPSGASRPQPRGEPSADIAAASGCTHPASVTSSRNSWTCIGSGSNTPGATDGSRPRRSSRPTRTPGS
jgi:putative phosphoribosyl transferase